MNIWFKYKKGEPVEISFKGKNVNALKKQIKTELKNQLGKFDINQITLRAPGKHENLCAEILIDEGFATSYNEPVVVETENYQEMKTFRIQCYDNEGVPLNKFERFTMCDEDFSKFLKRVEARGLENIDDNNEEPEIITSLEGIQANKYYRISASYLTAVKNGVAWTKVEDTALEDETTLAVKNFVSEKLKSPAKNFPNRVMHDDVGNPIMEWDGIFLCRSKVFLCESKHKITKEKLDMLVERLKDFPEKLKVTKDVEFKQLSNMKCIGVACATLFPIELRQKSVNELGLIIAYPGGGRYCVDLPSNVDECQHWCNYM
ncbi:4522_t:CDS:2 [Funneliformis geosporum]|nr:4522_t:CDS:2 [Funneliformis geosporum]